MTGAVPSPTTKSENKPKLLKSQSSAVAATSPSSRPADRRRHAICRRRKDSGYPASFLNRPQKCRQVGVDLIRVRGGETVWQARIINFLRPLDELADFFAESLTGTIWSSSPCMTRVGTSNFLRCGFSGRAPAAERLCPSPGTRGISPVWFGLHFAQRRKHHPGPPRSSEQVSESLPFRLALASRPSLPAHK